MKRRRTRAVDAVLAETEERERCEHEREGPGVERQEARAALRDEPRVQVPPRDAHGALDGHEREQQRRREPEHHHHVTAEFARRVLVGELEVQRVCEQRRDAREHLSAQVRRRQRHQHRVEHRPRLRSRPIEHILN